MKTTKILKSLLVLFLCLASTPASAQKESWEELVNRNRQIEKEIQALLADTTALYQTIIKFGSEQSRLDVQIDSITNLCNELKGDVDNKKVATVQQKVDSLNCVAEKLQTRKKELAAVRQQKESSLASLKSNISSMGAYSAIKDEQMYAQYKEVLTKPYSEITITVLDEIESKMRSFTKLPDFADFKARLNACKNNKKLYDLAENLLNEKLNSDIIDKTRDKLYELLDIKKDDPRKGIVKLSEAQYSEIDTLDIKLSRYGNGISVLQNIVKAVNESNVREQYQGNESACIDAMHSIVISDAPEDVENWKRYFDMIPTLKALCQKYWNELQADPFTAPTETETLIMQLKNE